MGRFDYLWSLEKFGIKLGLDNMKKALLAMGNIEKNLRVIHVAGTNGIGSVSAMITSILGAAGYKVGLYTSPHLVRVHERIRIGTEEISDEDLEKHIAIVKGLNVEVTFFSPSAAFRLRSLPPSDPTGNKT